MRLLKANWCDKKCKKLKKWSAAKFATAAAVNLQSGASSETGAPATNDLCLALFIF